MWRAVIISPFNAGNYKLYSISFFALCVYNILYVSSFLLYVVSSPLSPEEEKACLQASQLLTRLKNVDCISYKMLQLICDIDFALVILEFIPFLTRSSL